MATGSGNGNSENVGLDNGYPNNKITDSDSDSDSDIEIASSSSSLDEKTSVQAEDESNLGQSLPSLSACLVLENDLAQARSKLSAIRQERERQWTQLEQLQQEQETLQSQKHFRTERFKLQDQVEELQAKIDAKSLLQQMATQEVQQTHAHYRQLQKTLHMLQDGIQLILEQSTSNDYDHRNPTVKKMAAHRQSLVTEILRENWNLSHRQVQEQQIGRDDTERSDKHDTRETIIDSAKNQNDMTSIAISSSSHSPIQMFHERKSRYESIDSMMSDILSIADPLDITTLAKAIPPSISRKPSVIRAAHDLAAGSRHYPHPSSIHKSDYINNFSGHRTKTRSKYYQEGEEEAKRRDQHRRSRSFSSHDTYGRSILSETTTSTSADNKNRDIHRTRSFEGNASLQSSIAPEHNTISSSSSTNRKNPSLYALLERSKQNQKDDGEVSQDTPKTTNT